MKKLSIFFIVMILLDTVPCKNLSSFASTIATISSDDEKKLLDAVAKLNGSSSGGVIYINTSIIRISSTSTIKLTSKKAGGIIGMKQSNGAYPVIDFKNARNKGSTARGFTISGENQYMKYLIIQNAGDNGIWVNGSKNTLDHIITRYNGDSGIQLSDNAASNTLSYCYSYRNIDVPTYGANADGFAPKLGATNTVFNYCFAWDNSDDGWDSYDKQGDNSATVDYQHSACWNNGNVDVFTGKYDYDNGAALDKNMRTIQYLISSDSKFESNYNNKKFAISSSAKIYGISASTWIATAENEMNGNGFKFGSKTTEQSTNVKRIANYCVAFDHKSKGFDNNNSKGCAGYISNCASFKNNINYQLPYVFKTWSNNWSWSHKKSDQSNQKQTLKSPKNASAATANFYKIRDSIIKNCKANKFNDNVNFDSVIKNLS